MTRVELLLAVATATAVVAWAALSWLVIAIERRRVATRSTIASVLTTFGAMPDDRADGHQTLVMPLGVSRELVIRAATDPRVQPEAFAALTNHLVTAWSSDALIADASAHRSRREKWRRMSALQILARMKHERALECLSRAITEPDDEVAATALALLGQSRDPRAVDILIDTLRHHRHLAAVVAVHLDQTPQPIVDRLRSLLTDTSPIVRRWAATLLARYPEEWVELEVAPLVEDTDPLVRKAAIQTLGAIGEEPAAACAQHLLRDPAPAVRASAARALAALDRGDLAEAVAALLGDREWSVRFAAREALSDMGPDVWPVLVRCLRDDDRFLRNGAAEVLQNLGVVDSLIVMEAASDSPSASKVTMLRDIAAAGGVRFTDSLVERAGPVVGPRIRELLSRIGLDHVDAA